MGECKPLPDGSLATSFTARPDRAGIVAARFEVPGPPLAARARAPRTRAGAAAKGTTWTTADMVTEEGAARRLAARPGECNERRTGP